MKPNPSAPPARNVEMPGTVLRKISGLKPVEYNRGRIINERQEGELETSVAEFGLVQPLVINTHPGREGRIVGGEKRWMRLRSLGVDEATCIEVHLPLERERELNLRLNRNGGEWDYAALREEFAVEELLELGFERWEFKDLPRENLQLETGGGEGPAPGATNPPPGSGMAAAPPSPVRMVQLFFNEADYNVWVNCLTVLGTRFGTETPTDTALAALRFLLDEAPNKA